MKPYAQTRVAALIAKFATQATRAAAAPDADAVHDLRVSIRRLSRGLRVFAQFFPGKSWKRIRRELSEIMDHAAAVRDRDIAVELLHAAGIAGRAGVFLALHKQRREAAQSLQDALRNWRESNRASQWKEALEL